MAMNTNNSGGGPSTDEDLRSKQVFTTGEAAGGDRYRLTIPVHPKAAAGFDQVLWLPGLTDHETPFQLLSLELSPADAGG